MCRIEAAKEAIGIILDAEKGRSSLTLSPAATERKRLVNG
jgi:hypothetical protein